MQKDEAIKILARHLMQCGSLMPIEWVQKNGEGSEFMQAYEMAMDALKNEPVRCKNCQYFRIDPDDYLGICKCGSIATNYGGEIYPEREHFCSYGERREGE